MGLSDRLQLVLDNLIPDKDVWDFCCDHGYLGGAAYKSKRFKDIYFVDPVPSIMENLKSRFQKFVHRPENKSTAYFLTQKGETVNQAVQGNVSIIGVGGSTICEILMGLVTQNVFEADRMILGPHKDSKKMLEFIASEPFFSTYKLNDQKSVVENGRQRDFFIFDKI